MLDPDVEQKMDIIAEQIFGTANDPEQIAVTKESGRKLDALTSNWIAWDLNDKGDPIAWVIVLPTTKKLAERFVASEITERDLLDQTSFQQIYSAIYLCAAITILQYRHQGRAQKLFIQAISKIPKTLDYIVCAWPTGDGGMDVAKRVGEKLGKKILVR